MTKYQKEKEKAREEAISWQCNFGEHSASWEEIALATDYFEKQAKRYGLVSEFRENGII